MIFGKKERKKEKRNDIWKERKKERKVILKESKTEK